MSVMFLPRYDRLGASSRLRFFMYFDSYIKNGGRAEIKPGMSDEYLHQLYRAGRVGLFCKLREFMRMFFRAAALPENLIIEYELVPELPYKYEKHLIGSRKYILNFDDNVWDKYRDKAALKDKYDHLCRNAAGVIVANDFLREKVSSLNDNVIVIPTVVDLDHYAGSCGKYSTFTAAWIGTPVTYKYLESHLEALQMMFGTADRQLLVIADKRLGASRPLPGVNARYVDWSQETEAEYLKKCHLGIMPLDDDEFSRGKSAYKLLQYQAAGLPLLASPVGENCRVVTDDFNGFLAQTPREWQEKLDLLCGGTARLDQFCSNARSRAYEYSFQKYFPIFTEFVNKTFYLPESRSDYEV